MTLLQGDCLELMKDTIDLILCDDTTADTTSAHRKMM